MNGYTHRIDSGGLLNWLWDGIQGGLSFGPLVPEENADPVVLLNDGRPGSSVLFSPSGSEGWVNYRLSSSSDKALTFEGQEGSIALTTRYTSIDEDYRFKVDVTMRNASGAPWVGKPSITLIEHPHEAMVGPFAIFQSVIHIANEVEVVERSDLDDGNQERFSGPVNWLGVGDNYFFSSVLMPEGSVGTVEATADDDGIKVVYQGNETLSLAPGATQTLSYELYVGPKEIDRLTALERDLEKAIDFGFLSVFAYPLLYLLKFFYSIVGSWGLAIIVLTFSVKALTFPLTQKQMVSMQRMKELQPEMKALQEKHADNREALNLEMAKLMSEKKVNPLGGCLPTLVQMPVWFALYRVLQSSIELYHTPFLYISDLSAADPYGVSPILVGVLMFMQQRLTPTAASMDPTQQKMMQFLPLFFSFIMFSLPAGLVVYILVNSVISISHHTLFTRYHAESPA